MKCSVCKREMFLLFVSYVCDHCEGDAPLDWFSGFIVYQPERLGSGNPFHVFRTLTDAAIWRSAAGLQHCELREILSEDAFLWRQSRGNIDDIQIANQPFEIFADHRFEALPHRACVAPRPNQQAA